MSQLIFHRPATNLSPVQFEATQAQDFAGSKAVGSWRFAGESFVEEGQDFRWPFRSVVAAGEFGSPLRLPVLSTGTQVIAIKFVKATFAQMELIQGIEQRDLLITESA